MMNIKTEDKIDEEKEKNKLILCRSIKEILIVNEKIQVF